MRALLFCLLGLITASPDLAFAQIKLSTKPANPNETRYFTAIDGLMDGNADVILKENRQGKTVTSAVLDVCYPAEKGSDRKDRFVADLAVNGQTMTGTAQTLGGKLPVTVKLVRKPTGDTFEFKGQISIGTTVTEVASSDNSDLSEREFKENQTVDDGITPAPKDFSEVSPESIGVRVKLDAAVDFLKALKGQAGGSRSQQPHRHLRCAARRRADHRHVDGSGSRRSADREVQVTAGRGRRRLDHRHRRHGSHDPLFRRRLARRRQNQQGQARRRDHRRADQDAGGEIVGGGLERQHRHAEIDVQAAEPAILRARPHRDGRNHGAGVPGQARRLRQADAVDQQSRDYDGGRIRGRQARRWPRTPAATRKATRRTTTARSRRWRRNSRASAGTRTNRPGNSQRSSSARRG